MIEERFHLLAEKAPVGIAVCLRSGKVLFANRICAYMFGLSEGAGLSDRTMAEYIISDGRPEFIKRIKLQKHEETVTGVLETAGLRQDGSNFPISIKVSVINLHHRSARVIFISDITEREITEEKLRRAYDDLDLKIQRRADWLAKRQEALPAENDSCKQTDLLLDNSEDIRRWIADRRNEGIWILDDRNNTIFTNRKMAEMLGYTIDEMAETPDRLFLNQKWRENIEEEMLRCRKGIRERIECKLLRKDGTDLWVNVCCIPIFNDDGSYDGVIGVLSEIAEHRQLEDALRAAEEQFLQIFYCSSCTMAIVSCIDNRYIDVNDAFLNVTGASRNKVIGYHDEDLGWETVSEETENILKKRISFKNFEWTFTDRSGREFCVLFSRELIVLNQESCFLCIGTDVTKQKKIEEEIARLKDLRLARQAAGSIPSERLSPLTAVGECFRFLKKKSKAPRCGTVLSFIVPFILLSTASFHAGLYGETTGFPWQSLSSSYSAEAPSPLVSAYGREAPGSPVSAPSNVSKISLAGLQQQRLQIPSTYKNKVAVLMYHDVNPNSHQDINVTPDRLDADLTLLQQEGFHIISIAQMAAFMEHRATVPEKAIALTFDDGYQGVYQYAFPVLKKHNAPAAVFIIGYDTGRVTGYLTWPEVRQLEESGLVTIGGHTYNQHQPEQTARPNFVKPATVARIVDLKTGHEETDQEYEDRMLADSQLFQDTLKSELGHTTPYFAYPYGAYNATMLKILRNTGFEYMFTVFQGVNGEHEDTTRLYRINVGATWISTKNIPSIILKTVFSSPSGKQPAAWLPEWKS
ncbi:MAG: PAS domain S-box protein [Thermacetogeniaceae bacterium]